MSNETAEVDYSGQLSPADYENYMAGNFGAMTDQGIDIVTGAYTPGLIPSAINKMGEAAEVATGVARDVGDWFAGAKVQYPNLPIAGHENLGLKASAGQQAQLMTLITSTLDPDRLDSGIKEIFPGAMTMRDSFGNVIASVPSIERGRVQGWKTFYPNPRGLDIPTATQLTGAVALAQVLEPAVAALGVPSVMGADVATVGLAEGAIIEELSALSSGESFNPFVAGESGAWAGAAYGFGRILSSLGGKMASLFRKNPTKVVNKDSQLTKEAKDYLKSVGIDPDEVQIAIYDDLARMLREGSVPEEALAKMRAQGLPVPVELTTGQITGDLEQQLFEDLASKGVYGDRAKEIITERFAAQEAAIEENITAMQQIIARGGPAVARQEGGAAIQQALYNAKKAARDRADKMYESARELGQSTYLDPNYASGFGTTIAEQVGKNFDPLAIPVTDSIMKNLSDAFEEGVGLERIQTYRTQLVNQAKNGRGSDAQAAREVLGLLDDKLYEMADANLLYGNAEAVGAWANAIKNYRGFKETWDSKGGILNTLTKRVVRDGVRTFEVAPQAAAQKVLGATFSGLISKPEAIRTLNTLKNQLPKAEWDMFRQEAFMLISDGIQSTATGRAANKFPREFRDARRRNPELLGTLFEPEELQIMSDLAETTARMTRTAKNASNSGAAIGSILGRLMRSMGSTNIYNAVGEWMFVNGARTSYGRSRAASAVTGQTTGRRRLSDSITLGGGAVVGGTPEVEEEEDVEVSVPLAAAPQARRPAPPTRGLPTGEAPMPAPAAPQMAEAPSPTDQGPSQSRQMLADLFPFDPTLRVG